MNQQNSLRSSTASLGVETATATALQQVQQRKSGSGKSATGTLGRKGKLNGVAKTTSSTPSSRESSPAKSRPTVPPKPEDLVSSPHQHHHVNNSNNGRCLQQNSPRNSGEAHKLSKSSPTSNGKNYTNSISRKKKPESASPSSTNSSPRGIHKPGHLPAYYLNKSTPHLNSPTIENNHLNGAGGSPKRTNRAVARPISTATMTTKATCPPTTTIESLLEPRPLAPTAKFRSDGEISICDPHSSNCATMERHQPKPTAAAAAKSVERNNGAAKVESGKQQIIAALKSSNGEKRERFSKQQQQQLQRTVAKNATTGKSGALSSKSTSSSGHLRAEQRIKHRKQQQQQQQQQQPQQRIPFPSSGESPSSRLSSEVQCWPWPSKPSEGNNPTTKCSSVNNTRAERGEHHFSKVRSRSLTFFQRLGGLTRSLSVRGTSSSQKSPRRLLQSRVQVPDQPRVSLVHGLGDEVRIGQRERAAERKSRSRSRLRAFVRNSQQLKFNVTVDWRRRRRSRSCCYWRQFVIVFVEIVDSFSAKTAKKHPIAELRINTIVPGVLVVFGGRICRCCRLKKASRALLRRTRTSNTQGSGETTQALKKC